MLSFLVVVGMFLFCAELSISDAIFGATCSFAVQHMSYVRDIHEYRQKSIR